MSIYKSYCNEFIDYHSLDVARFKKIENQLKSDKKYETYKKEVKNAEYIIKDLTQAIKFKIPACDQLLPEHENPVDFAKQFIQEANLPYPLIALELDAGTFGQAQDGKLIIIAKQEGNCICITSLVNMGTWQIMHQNKGDFPIHLKLNTETFEVYMNGFNLDETNDYTRRGLVGWFYRVPLRAILNLLCILSCSNSRIEDSPEKPSRLKSDMRKSKKKLPFFEFKILTIDSDKPQQNSSGGTGSHASPRVHLRRGHIRKLPTKNVWVNACVVGDKAKGVIQKDYLVKS